MSDVCVVTDDPSVATALKGVRSEWSLSIATDARAACTLLGSGSVAVVLLDRRSPWVDDDLIRSARDLSPDTVRVALVPDTSVSDAVKTAKLAHQVMPADSGAAAVASACDRAVRVRDMLSDPRVRALVAEAPELAAPPELWVALNEVLDDPNSGASEVAEVVASDPVSAAQVLRLANSAFFGLSRTVTQLKDAVSLIGFTTIRALVLESTTSRSLPSSSVELDRAGMQKHALTTARVARAIAGSSRSADAFLAGLLMDVGVVLLAATRPDAMRQALEAAAESRRPLHTVEEEFFGFTHAAVGAALLGLWGMPYSVLDAVAHHHTMPDLDSDLSVREALYLARDATQVYGAFDPYDVNGALVSDDAMHQDTTLGLLVYSARSVASDLAPDEV